MPLSRAAIAVGADGLIVDFHPETNLALCDGDQALVGADRHEFAETVIAFAPLVGRTLTPPPAGLQQAPAMQYPIRLCGDESRKMIYGTPSARPTGEDSRLVSQAGT